MECLRRQMKYEYFTSLIDQAVSLKCCVREKLFLGQFQSHRYLKKLKVDEMDFQ